MSGGEREKEKKTPSLESLVELGFDALRTNPAAKDAFEGTISCGADSHAAHKESHKEENESDDPHFNGQIVHKRIWPTDVEQFVVQRRIVERKTDEERHCQVQATDNGRAHVVLNEGSCDGHPSQKRVDHNGDERSRVADVVDNKLGNTELGKVEDSLGVHCLYSPKHKRNTEAHNARSGKKNLHGLSCKDALCGFQIVVDIPNDKQEAKDGMKRKTPAREVLHVPPK